MRIIPGKSISGIFNEKGYLDNDAIKDAIINYGAVYATFIWNEAYFNAANSAYRCPRVIGSGEPHGVAIVGWDDNFPASKFGKIALDDILIRFGLPTACPYSELYAAPKGESAIMITFRIYF